MRVLVLAVLLVVAPLAQERPLPDFDAFAAEVKRRLASGAIASGSGYVVWYAALRGLSGMQAAIVQLAVPVLAAVGGVVFLAELVSLRLVVSAILVLGGIALATPGLTRTRGVIRKS